MEAVELKLRADLIVSKQSGPEGIMSVIKDPITDRFFQLREMEHFIAQQFDGTASEAEIMQRVEKRFGVSLSAVNLAQFTRSLQGMGLLIHKSHEIDGRAIEKARRWKLNGDLFYLRGKLFNPDRLFNWLHPRISFLFTPAFLVVSGVVVLMALNITITDWALIVHQSNNLFQLESLVLAWFVMLSVVLLHESAHGLTCKHFGGQVREIGFLLVYFQPAFYCNVSDAWLFPKKAQRMWVTFAGGYFEVFLWALATIIWRVTDLGTSINHFALIVTATSALKMFFNMNPLIKLDGYYLLCDWIEIPNLRQKAGEYFNYHFKRLLGFKSNQIFTINPRLRNFFILYSILSTVYIYWILSNVIGFFFDAMVRNYQALGFVVFVLTVAFVFRKFFASLFSPLTSPSKRSSTAAVPRASRKFRVPTPLKWLVALAALTAALIVVRMELKIPGVFVVLPQHNADVRTEAEGIIEKIFVNEGDPVRRGDHIAQLSDLDYQADLQKTLAEIESRQADLRLLEAGAKPEEIDLVKTQVVKADEQLALSRKLEARKKQLVEQSTISMTEYEDAKAQMMAREREVAELKGRLKLLRAGNRTEEMEAAEANIRALQVHEQFLRKQLQLLDIVSPIDGVVTTPKLKEKIGQNVRRGDLVAEVYAMKQVIVEISIPEKEIGDVHVGQKVMLKARAYPGETFEGTVVTIAPVATKAADDWVTDRSVRVTTQLSNERGLLKPEMTGTCKIFCGEQPLIELISRRFVRYFRVEFWSWW